MKPSELSQLLLVVADAAYESGHDWLGEFMQKLAKEGVPKSLADVAHAMEKEEYQQLIEAAVARVEQIEEDMREEDRSPRDLIERSVEGLIPRWGLEQSVHILAYASSPGLDENDWRIAVHEAAFEAVFSDVRKELRRRPGRRPERVHFRRRPHRPRTRRN